MAAGAIGSAAPAAVASASSITGNTDRIRIMTFMVLQ
jgi:hypothetical protein